MFSSEEVKVIAKEIAEEYDGAIDEEQNSFTVKISTPDKLLHIDWPKHDLAEVWVTFQQNGIDLYQDWFECMQHEDKTEFVQYIKSIAARYLGSQVRVKRHGLIFRRYVLEYQNGDRWCELLAR